MTDPNENPWVEVLLRLIAAEEIEDPCTILEDEDE